MKYSFLIKLVSENHIKFNEFKAYATNKDLILFVNEFSIETAMLFRKCNWSFQTCDQAMIYLFSFLTDENFLDFSQNTIPSLPLEVYDSFAEGEFVHKGDSTEVCPIQKYVIPLLDNIINENQGELSSGQVSWIK